MMKSDNKRAVIHILKTADFGYIYRIIAVCDLSTLSRGVCSCDSLTVCVKQIEITVSAFLCERVDLHFAEIGLIAEFFGFKTESEAAFEISELIFLYHKQLEHFQSIVLGKYRIFL